MTNLLKAIALSIALWLAGCAAHGQDVPKPKPTRVARFISCLNRNKPEGRVPAPYTAF